MSAALRVAIEAHLDAHPRRRQQTVADLAGIDRTKLSHILCGRRQPKARERRNLARVLEKPEADLFPEVTS